MTTESQRLVDHLAITDCLYRYCRSVDRLDPELGYSIWHSDSVADYGEFYCGDGPGLIDLICEQHRHTLCHSHQMSNVLIQFDGDCAGSESYITANLRLKQGDDLMQMTIWSRYVDQWSKQNGRWGLDRREAIVDFDELRSIKPLSPGDSRAARDSSDPSFAVLAKLPSSFL